jgi:hypothetical protein
MVSSIHYLELRQYLSHNYLHMANIRLTDLAVNSVVRVDRSNNSGSFIRDLSTDELALQGGRYRRPAPILPTPIVSNNPTPVDPLFGDFSSQTFPGFYI